MQANLIVWLGVLRKGSFCDEHAANNANPT